MKRKIIISGAGGIGRACGLILLRQFPDSVELNLCDVDREQCDMAESWIQSGLQSPLKITKTKIPSNDPESWNPQGDILLDCSPGRFAPVYARVALRNRMHYANLTENVPATQEIYAMAMNAPKGFAMQTGLAPGFINQLARKLTALFTTKFPEYTVDHIKMRVGSLSQYASSPGFYAFAWNPMGVSTEYLYDCEVIENKKFTTKPALSQREKIIINGIVYEADLTSGGAADLPAYFDGKIDKLDYKTMRYPGHFDYIDQLKKELGDKLTKESLLERMLKDIPFHDQDRVLIYCSVGGTNPANHRQEMVHHSEILPVDYGSVTMTAIQRATASALAQTAILLLTGRYQGLLTQSQYPLDEFLDGETIREHYGTLIKYNYEELRRSVI